MDPGLSFNPEVVFTSGYAKRASVVTCVCLTTTLREISFYFYGFTPVNSSFLLYQPFEINITLDSRVSVYMLVLNGH